MDIINTSAYKFVGLTHYDLAALRETFLTKGQALELKGTVLLSNEGINLNLAGRKDNIENYQTFLASHPELNDLQYKDSVSPNIPFRRMLVKVKKEIIKFSQENINPQAKPAPYVTPEELKSWYAENKDMVVLDTRNTYEYKLGKFKDAITPPIESFTDFANYVKQLPNDLKEKTVVTYCTGGIRCEKAAVYMQQQGFKNVFQLDGGILNYFEQCGNDFYEGECFVFDKRIGVDATLETTNTIQCRQCRSPITEQALQEHQQNCPYCSAVIDYEK